MFRANDRKWTKPAPEHHRQPSGAPAQGIFKNKRMQLAIRRAAQSSRQRSGASDTDIQEPPHQWNVLHRQRVASPTMAQTHRASIDNAQFMSHKQKRATKIGVPFISRAPIRLEQEPNGAPRHTSGRVSASSRPPLMGTAGHRRMVLWSSHGPLSKHDFLCPGNASLPHVSLV